jgi:hypothetical protein
MSKYTGSAATSFPQTSKNRSLDELKAELAGWVGGKSRDTILSQAQSALFSAIQEFNDVPWSFNLVTEDIVLATEASGTVGEYDLTNDWLIAARAQLVDSNSKTRDRGKWIDWRRWAQVFPDQSSTGSSPTHYTARSVFRVGRVTVDPPLDTSNLTYPTMRLWYYTRIDCPTSGGSKITCPSEVEEAIFQRAVSLLVAKRRSFKESRDATAQAQLRRASVERYYRGWEDY